MADESQPRIDLTNFENDEFADQEFVLTSPRSLEACRLVSVQPAQLLYCPLRLFRHTRPPDEPAERMLDAFDAYETARKERLQLAREARLRVIAEQAGAQQQRQLEHSDLTEQPAMPAAARRTTDTGSGGQASETDMYRTDQVGVCSYGGVSLPTEATLSRNLLGGRDAADGVETEAASVAGSSRKVAAGSVDRHSVSASRLQQQQQQQWRLQRRTQQQQEWHLEQKDDEAEDGESEPAETLVVRWKTKMHQWQPVQQQQQQHKDKQEMLEEMRAELEQHQQQQRALRQQQMMRQMSEYMQRQHGKQRQLVQQQKQQQQQQQLMSRMEATTLRAASLVQRATGATRSSSRSEQLQESAGSGRWTRDCWAEQGRQEEELLSQQPCSVCGGWEAQWRLAELRRALEVEIDNYKEELRRLRHVAEVNVDEVSANSIRQLLSLAAAQRMALTRLTFRSAA